MSMVSNLYNQDFYAWTQEQAKLLHNKHFTSLDISHLEEELLIMGASEKRELESRLEQLLMHLLKWKYIFKGSKYIYTDSKSWMLKIKEQRIKITRHLNDNPSLKNKDTFNEIFNEAYATAILRVAEEIEADESIFPIECEWSSEQVMDNNFYPN